MSDLAEFLRAIEVGDLPQVEGMLIDRTLATAVTAGGMPVLLYALHQGHPAVARAIASRRPHLSLLEHSAMGDADKVAAALARTPALINEVGPDGYTPLGIAVLFSHLPVVELLLQGGADPNLARKDGVSPLHSAAAQPQPGQALTLTRMLLEQDASPNARAHGGWTPLHRAAAMGYLEVCVALVEAGADPHAATDSGKTAGQLAEELGFDGVGERLERGDGPVAS